MSYISTNLNMLMTVAKKVSGGLARDFNELEKLQTSIKTIKEAIESLE